ncbi:hypothetical protein PS15m_001667 [Mucor circinelloides]
MNTTLEQDDIAYENNSPKLQWLILLIPMLGAFIAYSLIRMHNKRRRAQQLLLDQALQRLPASNHYVIAVPSPAHPSSLSWQRFSAIEQDQRERRRQQRRTQRQQHDAPPPPAYSPSSTLPKYEDITEPTQTH